MLNDTRSKRIRIALIVLVIIIVLAIIIPFCVLFITNNGEIKSYCSFTSIEQLAEFLDNNTEVIEKNFADNKLQNLTYIEQLTIKVRYDNNIYLLCAYTFENQSDAKAYFKNHTGRTYDLDKSFAASSKFYFNSTMTAYDGNDVLHIETSANMVALNKFYDLLLNKNLVKPS